METEFVGGGQVAKVKSLSDDSVYVEWPNGNLGWFEASTEDLAALSPGSIVFVKGDGTSIDAAPQDLWPDPKVVGTVRLVLDADVIVDVAGRLIRIPKAPTPCVEGNTVEFTTDDGVIRVLSDKPLKYIDIRDDEDLGRLVDGFRQTAPTGYGFDDFAGGREIVRRARDLVETPLRHADALRAIGARPIKGVLFTGPPGTGKTMLARIIAESSDAAIYEISGPEVVSKWVGATEELLRQVFKQAATHERAIIFFDEIDSIAAKRGDDSHESSKRVVAQLLTLMDGSTLSESTVVIATTNRPQDLDSALTRAGRFDWIIEFPLPLEADRLQILDVSSAQVSIERPLDFDAAVLASEGWSSADLAAVWSEAALLAVTDGRRAVNQEDFDLGFKRVAANRSAKQMWNAPAQSDGQSW